MTAESGEISGLSGRVMAVSLVVGACAIAILTVNWDRGRTKVGAFYDIAPRLGGLAPVGHADKGNTDHYRVAFKGPEIFAARRMTSKGGPLPLFDNRDRWAWFLSPDQVCLDCSGAVIYGALMTYSEGEVIRVDFRDIDGDTVQHYTVARQGEVYQLDHSQPSPRRGVEREEHTYDSFDRISEVKFEGGDVRYVRDEKGRVIEEITRGPQASRVKFTYGEERHPARPSDRVNAGPDVHGCTIEHTDWDSIGHPVLIQCLNELRQPVVSTMGGVRPSRSSGTTTTGRRHVWISTENRRSPTMDGSTCASRPTPWRSHRSSPSSMPKATRSPHLLGRPRRESGETSAASSSTTPAMLPTGRHCR